MIRDGLSDHDAVTLTLLGETSGVMTFQYTLHFAKPIYRSALTYRNLYRIERMKLGIAFIRMK